MALVPYYESDGVVIYQGDSRSVLSDLRIEPLVVFTDPPYGIDYVPMRGGHRPIENDGTLMGAAALTRDVLLLSPATAHFICCDWRSLPSMVGAMEAAGLAPKSCIVWDKMRPVQNLDRFAKQHEMVLYAGPFGGEPTRRTDVWRVDREYDRAEDHPTPKPVKLVQLALASAGKRGCLVLDPFMGSGTTLLAARHMGCQAVGIEIDERYCEAAATQLESLDSSFSEVAFADWADEFHPRKGSAVVSLFEDSA